MQTNQIVFEFGEQCQIQFILLIFYNNIFTWKILKHTQMNMKYATVYAKRNFYKMRYETNKMKRNEIYKIYFFFWTNIEKFEMQITKL